MLIRTEKMPKNKNLKVAGDLIYTVMATAVINVVLQIIIYPLITRYFGEDTTGSILYFIGFVYIVPQAFGTALSNTRLVVRKTCDTSNSDMALLIAAASAITALSCGIVGFLDDKDIVFAVFYALFSVIYMLRAYAQVDFRLNLKFKEYFLYYCIISVGYLIGLGLYFITEIWIMIFIVGEAAALIYSLCRGTIFKKDKKCCKRGILGKTMALITVSTLARDCVIQFDKVILKSIGSETVMQYHVVSLIAKTMQMLIQPINTLILSYLTVKDAVLSKKTVLKFSVIAVLLGGGFYGACIIGTPIYLKLFYPSLYDIVMPYNFIVNLGLIVGFLASLFMALTLSQGKTSAHTAIECVHGAVYIISAYYFVSKYAIWGLAYVTLAMNAVKLCLAVVCLFVSVCKGANEDKCVQGDKN